MQDTNYSWLNRTEYPFPPHYLTVNGQQMHYIDEGAGEAIVFIHGTPSWSFDFRKQIRELSQHYRCIAMDHIGFGLSEKPVGAQPSLQDHVQNITYLINKLGLLNITLVVHDFGGPIGFDYALSHPKNIKRLIILNSWLWDFSEAPAFKTFEKVARSPLLPFLYKWFNFSARVLLPKSFGDKRITKDVLLQYTKPFESRLQRLGPLSFAYALLNEQQWFESLWQMRTALQNKHILFIWGMKDRFVTPDFLKRFSDGFQDSTVIKLDSCGHFPQEEESEQVTGAIKKFLIKDEARTDMRTTNEILPHF